MVIVDPSQGFSETWKSTSFAFLRFERGSQVFSFVSIPQPFNKIECLVSSFFECRGSIRPRMSGRSVDWMIGGG